MLLGKRDTEDSQLGHALVGDAPRIGLALLHIARGLDRSRAGCPATYQLACGKLLVSDRGRQHDSYRLGEKSVLLTRTCSNSASVRPSSRPPSEQDTSVS